MGTTTQQDYINAYSQGNSYGGSSAATTAGIAPATITTNKLWDDANGYNYSNNNTIKTNMGTVTNGYGIDYTGASGGSPHETNTYANAPTLFSKSDTGAYYPDSVPDTLFKGASSTLTGGLTNLLLKKIGGEIGKEGAIGGLLDAYLSFDPLGTFAEQTVYGMNKEAMLEYSLQESSNPDWANMSEADRVSTARSPQLTNQLLHAYIGGGKGNLTEAQLDSIRPDGWSDSQWADMSKEMKNNLAQGDSKGLSDTLASEGEIAITESSNGQGTGTVANASDVLDNLMNGNSSFNNGANMAATTTDAGWLSQQYQNLLGRDIGAAGLDYYTDQLATGGKSREQIIADLNYSAEGQGYTTQAEAEKFTQQAAIGSAANNINQAYRDTFDRNMGQEGLNFYENKFATDPTYTDAQFRAELADSVEGRGHITQAEAAADPTLTATGSRMDRDVDPLINIQAQLAQYVDQGGDGATGDLSPIQALLDQFKSESGGATVPDGSGANVGNFKPVTFRSGTGASAVTPSGSATELAEPYASISDMVGQGQGLFGRAATLAQQAPDQFNYNFNPEGRATELFNQRSALLDPAFAQQNARAREGMFGTGRLGLKLAGEGLGAGAASQMMQPDALGINNAQAQALAGLAQQSTNDAYGQEIQRAGLDLSQFNTNQMTNQQQYANLMGTGAGMFSGGLQAPALEAQLAGIPLQTEALRQNYQLGLLNQETARMTGQAALNTSNYQPNPWISGLTSAGAAYAGTAGGAESLGKAGGWLWDSIFGA